MGYYIGNALVSTLEGDPLLALDAVSAREGFLQLAAEAPSALECVFGGPLNTYAKSAIDQPPAPERFGATMVHAPSFGVGSWKYAPDPNLVPGRSSSEVVALSQIAAAHKDLELRAPHFTNNVFLFAEGLRRRQAFYLAYEAGIVAGDPAEFSRRDLANCPPVQDRLAFSIYLNLAAALILAQQPDPQELSRIEERLRAAAAHRAAAISEDAQIALNALLIQERRLVERHAHGQGLFAWTTVASSLDFTRPEELAGARIWLLDSPCPFAGEVVKSPERVEGALVTVSFDSDDRWPPRDEPDELMRYYESEDRALLITTPPPTPLARGKLSIDWFRRGPLVPPGHSRFSWTAICESSVPDDAVASDPILIREGGVWYRLRLEDGGDHAIIVAVEEQAE